MKITAEAGNQLVASDKAYGMLVAGPLIVVIGLVLLGRD